MKRTILVSMFFLIFTSFMSLNAQWARTYGEEWPLDEAFSIQQTSDGGYIVAGLTESFGAGKSDCWIIKLFPNGDIEWQRTYRADNWNSARSIQQTIDGGYIVAGNTWTLGVGKSDYWIKKLFPNGDIEWQRTYGGNDWDSAYSIQQTDDGGYIVAGETRSFGSDDYWVIKLFQNGDIEWQRAYGGGAASSIQQTNDGGYIVSGGSRVEKLSSTGNIEWQRNYGGIDFVSARSIQQTIDGGYIVAGNTLTCTKSYCRGDFFILKLLSDGDLHSSCEFKFIPSSKIADTSVSPVDTNITPDDTDVTPLDTMCLTQDTDVAANLICPLEYTFIISAGPGGTTDPVPGTHTYFAGTTVTIKAIPSIGYRFTGWTGDVPSGHENDNPVTITMDVDKSITSNFSAITEETGKKDGCFIATTAYGSPLHSYVRILRDFRDKYLMPSKLGRALVDIYYKYSPFVADVIMKHKVLKVAVRFSLLPVIVFSYSMLHFGATMTAFMLAFVFVLPIFFIWFFMRKSRRMESKDPKALTSLD